MGKGRAIDTMTYVWLVIVIMVTLIFFLMGFTNKTGEIIPKEQRYGPWYAWYLAVLIFLIIFVAAYHMSLSYAETVLATKWKAFQEKEIDVEKLKKGGVSAQL